MKNPYLLLLTVFLIFQGCHSPGSGESKVLKISSLSTPEDLMTFMRYSPDATPLVSAHRGGARVDFPENCIATFSNTIAHTPSIIEVDPRYTADSIIILMHDATLERTSTGTGKVTDHTYNQLLQYRLKDTEGKITGHTIPTLDEAIEWARNRAILILDRKDVPVEARVAKITEHNAESFVMVMAYSFEEALRCYQKNPDVMMEIMLPDTLQVKRFDETGVPWQNTVVFVSHNLVSDPRIFEMIHSRGAKCIVGSSRNYDLAYKKGEIGSIEELYKKYRSMIEAGADIIEADLAIEAGSAFKAIK